MVNLLLIWPIIFISTILICFPLGSKWTSQHHGMLYSNKHCFHQSSAELHVGKLILNFHHFLFKRHLEPEECHLGKDSQCKNIPFNGFEDTKICHHLTSELETLLTEVTGQDMQLSRSLDRWQSTKVRLMTVQYSDKENKLSDTEGRSHVQIFQQTKMLLLYVKFKGKVL